MTTPGDDLGALVERKLARVFGSERGLALLRAVLAELGLETIETNADLQRVAAALERRGGFEATAGTMLSVLAATRNLAESTAR